MAFSPETIGARSSEQQGFVPSSPSQEEAPGDMFSGARPSAGISNAQNTVPQQSPLSLTHPPSYTVPLPQRAPSWSKFSIQTKTDALSSGFPYDDRLEQLRVSHEDWFQFSNEIVNASKITFGEDYVAWTTGITTGTLTSPFLLVFAPWVGYIAGRKYHRKAIEKKVQQRLMGDGDIRSILKRWNESNFAEKNFSAWLALPDDPKEVRADGTKSKKRRFRILIIPSDGKGLPMVQSSSWSVNGSSTAETPIVEAGGDEYQIAKELQSNPPTNPPLPPPAFSANPDAKTPAFTTSPPSRAVGSSSGDGAAAAGPSGESTSGTSSKAVKEDDAQPAGTTDKKLPAVRPVVELP